MNEAVGMNNRFYGGWGREKDIFSFQKEIVMKMYWLSSSGSYLWEERTQVLE